MRCKNCGWQNPETATVCEKCHSKLKNTFNPNRPSNTRPGDNRSLGRTPTVMGGINPFASSAQTPQPTPQPVKQSAFHNPSQPAAPKASPDSSTPGQRPSICPDCGYPLIDASDSCPNCGRKIESIPSPEISTTPADSVGATQPYKGTILSSNPFPFTDNLNDNEPSLGDYSLQPIDENGQSYDTPLLINEGDIIVVGNERFLFTKVKK